MMLKPSMMGSAVTENISDAKNLKDAIGIVDQDQVVTFNCASHGNLLKPAKIVEPNNIEIASSKGKMSTRSQGSVNIDDKHTRIYLRHAPGCPNDHSMKLSYQNSATNSNKAFMRHMGADHQMRDISYPNYAKRENQVQN
jgi:hypothetical protein